MQGAVVPGRTHPRGLTCCHRRAPSSAGGRGVKGGVCSREGSVVAQAVVLLVAARKEAELSWAITEPCTGEGQAGSYQPI